MKTPIRISHLGLLESAPLLVAREQGFFAQEQLNVDLHCDLGVASICGKLSDQRIDGACLPAQMPVLLSMGAGVSKVGMDPVFLVSNQDMGLVLTQKAAFPERGKAAAPVLKIGVLGQRSPGCHLVKNWIPRMRARQRATPSTCRSPPVSWCIFSTKA